MATPAAIPGLILLTGPMFFAHLFNWSLFGVLTVQAYLYYIAFPQDHRGLKWVVAVIMTLELTQTILLTHDAFRVYAFGWGDKAQLDSIGLYWLNIPVLSGLVHSQYIGSAFLCLEDQYFEPFLLGRRLYLLYTARPVSVALAQGALELYDGVVCLRAGRLSALPELGASKIFIMWLAGSCICDVMITGSMFFYLHRAKKIIMAKDTSNLLTRTIALTVETGLLSCAVQLTALICFVVDGQTLLYTAPVSVTNEHFGRLFKAIPPTDDAYVYRHNGERESPAT
ncbi:hypothetical protein EUX98_g9029 [Antrodiella citrinella]|uniref:DUF6534 domain-containing protein n=1 Tax=Antrodiella citrinella TaxID=2447956 RepID=A0A4S4LZL6_9APHY|nr:hypothetical protein EUX98_g9029 [Antrodiella citrinella]